MKFLAQIKKQLRPDDLILKEVDVFIRQINDLLKKSKVSARCVRGGSTAKGTFLKGDHDVDLFVIFDSSWRSKNISDALFSAIRELKPERVHGSRDYFHVRKEDMTYEIVPVLEVKDTGNIENVTDMSPHHVSWVNERLDDGLRDDIRLAKKFCKAQKIYGAESYIQGFSGHVIDILIIYYDGFLNLIKAASKWKPKTIIDVERKHKDALSEMDSSKTYGPLIIVDPVQKERNAAAAISEEKFLIFVKACKEFLKNPSKDFFIEKEFDIENIKKAARSKKILVIDVESLDGKVDVVGAKIMKIYDHLKRHIILNNFSIIESDWKWDKKRKAQIYFIVKEKTLPKTFVHQGPPIKAKEACAAFKAKNEDVFTKKGRLYANVLRKYRTPESLIEHFISDETIRKKAKSIVLR